MCNVQHRGSLYRSPEEYMKCADQSDRIDVFALGNIFYYLLSDGQSPWYYLRNYDEGVKRWLEGDHPRLPAAEEYRAADEYRDRGENLTALVVARSQHPAFVALTGVMTQCWALAPEKRPSSWRVVQLLEEKWRETNPAAGGK
jgi:serine/threonine protein kinase